MRFWPLVLLVSAAACGGESIQVYDSAGNAKEPAPGPSAGPSLPALTGWGKARPKDEASQDPTLVAFRDTLRSIVERRDSAALAQRLAPTVKFSFGDSKGGPAGLFANWHQHRSMPQLWSTLSDVLAHGGVFETGSFYAPWTFKALPDSLDAFEYLVVRDSNVVVRAKPDAKDAGFGTLSYDIVRAGGPPDSLWRAIKLKDDRTGYVEAQHIRSPVEWRIGIRKYGGRWLIDFFVAGD
jgi:hypothetical protein